MEKALKNTIIAKKYDLSLKSFFKDKFRYWDDCYRIPFSYFRHSQKYLSDYIKSSCNNENVCPRLAQCHGHQFLQFMEAIYQFQRVAVIQKKVYFEYFLITNFKLTSNAKITLIPTKIKSWQVIAINKRSLNNLTYSERLSYLK